MFFNVGRFKLGREVRMNLENVKILEGSDPAPCSLVQQWGGVQLCRKVFNKELADVEKI